MVLGLKSKNKNRPSIKVEYIIHVEEIRPWPPSESLRSVQTVLLLWDNGEQNTGSFLSVAGDSNIVFNESFILSLTLYRDKREPDKFKKNYLEFSLVEPRKDKPKGHVLGTVSINLADYALNEDIISIDTPLIFKKNANNLVQSALTISLEPVEREGSNSSYNDAVSKEASLDNDDDDDLSENTSFTDDDASSHSSRTAGSFDASPSQNIKDGGYGNAGIDNVRARNEYVPFSKFSERSMTSVKNFSSPLVISSPSSVSFRDTSGKFNNVRASFVRERASYSSREEEYQLEDILLNSSNVGPRQVTMRSDTFFPRKAPAVPLPNSSKPMLKHAKSVNIHSSVEGNGHLYTGGKPPDLDIPRSSHKKGRVSATIERKEAKVEIPDGKNEWKSKIEMLEEELRETAAMEVGLYSVVAEHLSSVNKVHAPARRLSRFYINACKVESQAKRASAARAAVSGLVVVSKACGNDVPRLTFWLSNSIMLRAIVSQTAAELPNYNKPVTKSNDIGSVNESDDWEDVLTFIIALEKVESWLFSRIVESVWWQTLTPHMQPTVEKGIKKTKVSRTKKPSGKKNTLRNLEQGNFSMELWKKAFKDACERLCPIRAGGHECGCLSVLVKLVMEQLVNRLDVAMFNAILRDSAEDMPTDPLSDPISDSKVLPIPAGKSSFTAGAQLKNAIGNWSRWLTDLFGLEDDSGEASDIYGNVKKPKSFKSFRLLHELSDLMMLPFGMLANVSTRKEVVPMFGPVIIKRVLNNFVPDDFAPNPIPQDIIDALNHEVVSEGLREVITSFPCSASSIKYSPPPAALLTCVGEVGTQVLQSSKLSTLKKSYTSDDELDELDSPLTSIVPDSFKSSSALAKLSLMPQEKGGRNVVRHKLLREMWRDE